MRRRGQQPSRRPSRGPARRPFGGAAAALLGAALLAASTLGAASIPTVAPGSVVRWPGSGVEACELAGRRWPPLDGVCWFAIDLLTPAGALEVARLRAGERESRTLQVAEYPYPIQRITLEDDSKVNLSAADLERVRREQALVGALWSSDGPPRDALPLRAPLEVLPAGGRFGSRRLFNDQPRSPHSGADYAAAAGTPVLAAADGRVVLARDLFFSGLSLFVDHGDGLVSMYFHLSEAAVGEGDEVARGQAIGAVGASGRVTGPHLHFGLRWRGARVDPALLLSPVEGVPTLE